ncbi:hypothetical protein [Deinococcus irradiatisoli]|uniref:hypothetical protein n=1 Tax=Deinococcus irradiatisoli TaxID=2202254 RepID=UPI0015E84790|nr:hypothetical protein [Deinococcus irradiatisoli]
MIRLENELESAIREHQNTTALLVALGVLIGVGLAAWVLSLPPRDTLRSEDPEAPLFI